MGHRALIGNTLKDGKVEIYYSHWGALNAYDSGGKKPSVPEKDKGEKTWIVEDKFAFGKEVDYLHHEAVWLDGICYYPIWIFPSESVEVSKWKTERQGILVKANTGIEFNRWNAYGETKYLIDEITNLSVENKIKLMINYIVGHTCEGKDDIPEFSPLGYDWKFILMKELFEKLNKKK